MKFEERSRESPVHASGQSDSEIGDETRHTRATRVTRGTYRRSALRRSARRPSVAAPAGARRGGSKAKFYQTFTFQLRCPARRTGGPLKVEKSCDVRRVARGPDPGPPSRDNRRKAIKNFVASSGAVTTAISSPCTCSDAARAPAAAARAPAAARAH